MLCAASIAAGCGRSLLYPPFGGAPVTDAAGALEPAAEPPADGAADGLGDAMDAAADHAPPACVPEPEICNGIDDDCNGATDENLPAIPCPNGGYQYCVAGRYSDCPKRCEVCVPGSARACFTTFCTHWGTEACAPDGRSFGACQEATAVPPECLAIAQSMQASAALEQCCLNNGYCCVDTYDLDNDGDHDEMLGNCQAVSCVP